MLAPLASLLLVAAAPPPAAVVVTFDREGIIRPLRVEGLADRSHGRAVTPDDPVRIASVSKLVVALGVMRLVEAGKLDLDRDISAYLGWPLRHPDFPDRPVTLAHLLGHRSGIADGIDYALPLDADLQAEMAKAGAWDKSRHPGGDFAYANLNYPLIAAVIERVTGERFDRAMADLVLRPLGLDACFNWPMCSDATVGRAVVLYDSDGRAVRDDLNGQRPACPVAPAHDGGCDMARYSLGRHGAGFSPQGGLRISANGLARIGVMLLRQGEGFLRASSLERLAAMEPVHPISGEGSNGLFCAFGLAMHNSGGVELARPDCRSDLFGDGRQRIGHAGDAYGLRSGLWVDPERGNGIAYFVTMVPGDKGGRRSAYSRAEEELLDRAGASHPLVSPAAAH